MRDITLVAVALCLLADNPVFSQSLFINEFLASNTTILADEFSEFDDWVEIYNAGTSPVDIGGMYITDNLNLPTLWQIPATDPASTTVPASGFLLLWFDKDVVQGALHVNAKLSAGGESIGLFASDGTTPIDTLSFGPQSANISFGRMPDGTAGFQFFTDPTPEETNANSTGGSQANAPLLSIDGGFFSSSFSVELSRFAPSAEIRFTLDGSEPNAFSQLYTAPLSIDQTTTLRAKTFAPDLLPSPPVTATYFFNVAHKFPVIALSFEDADFFDPATGIYPNFEQDWERSVNVEFFENDNAHTQALNQMATVEIHGSGSASLPQKSLKLKALASGGSGFFEHSIFPDQPFDKYKRFLLRNSGQDWNYTMFHDAVVASFTGDINDVGNIIQQPDLYHQASRPTVVYLNGEYWGIHNLREHMQATYVEQHLGLPGNEIDLLDNDEVKEGTADNWDELSTFLENNNFSDDAKIAELANKVDLSNFLDYNVFNILVDNSDWPGNNYRRWRPKANGKWRFLNFDLDFSFGFFNFVPGGPTWNTGDASANALARSLDATQTGWPNPQWNTLFFRKPMENETFRRDYINRTADFLNVLFDPVRVIARIDQFETLYNPESHQHFERWNGGWNPFLTNVELLRQFANDRPSFMRQHVVEAFSEVTGTANITLQADPPDGGSIAFSTLNLASADLPWTGEYFTGINIPVNAVAANGFTFDSWSLAALGSSASGNVNLSGDLVLTARFTQGGTATENMVINEINYNSPLTPNSGDWVEIYNPESQTVDLSGWVLEDGGGGSFTLPNGTFIASGGFVVLVENVFEFATVHPGIGQVIGNFGDGLNGFKLSNTSELISLKNALQQIVDTVHYSDQAPWPPEANGNGPTLQLLDFQLDNALPSSWIAQAATPGQPNTASVLLPQTIDFPPLPDQLTTAQPFALNALASSGLPVTFTVLIGPASINGNLLILDGTTGSVFIEASQAGDNIWEAAPSVVRAFTVTEDTDPPPADYCTSGSTQPWLEWIGRVQFGSINNFSDKTEYSDFTNHSTTVSKGETVVLTVTPEFSWEVFGEYLHAWIDFNGDGDFDDPGELVLEKNGTGAISANVTIPTNAASGETRMRIAMQRGQFAEPCGTFLIGEVEDYTIDISASTSLPQTIDFPPLPDINTAAAPFSLNATASSGLPVSFQILSGPASLNGNVVTLDGVAGIITVRASQFGNAQWQAAPSVDRSFQVTDTPPPPTDYCTSSGEQPWQEWIENVNFGSINNSSFKEQYGDFTNLIAVATRGETINLTVAPAFSWQTYDEHFQAWIDFNGDGDFDDFGEMVLQAIGTDAVNTDVLIPLSATLGTTRLRVNMQRDQYAGACGDFTVGEVEDYTINIASLFAPDDGQSASLRISPNPADYKFTASFKIFHSGKSKLVIVNALGNEVYEKRMDLAAGAHRVTMDISHLRSGPYTLFLQAEGQKAKAARFMKIKE